MTANQTRIDQEVTWEDYEALVAKLYEILGKDDGIEILCYGRDCKIGDDQIDVLFQQPSGTHFTKTAVECKYLKEHVGRGIVDAFAGKIRRLGIANGVIVSRMGFTEPAKNAAQQAEHNIQLIELRQPVATDWAGRTTEISLRLNMQAVVYNDVQLSAKPMDGYPTIESGTLETSGDMLREIMISAPDGRTVPLQQIMEDKRKEQPDNNDFTVQFPDGYIMTREGDDGCVMLTVLRFKVSFADPVELSERTFNLKDRVRLIVKSIFENREWLWFKDGRIVEQQPQVE